MYLTQLWQARAKVTGVSRQNQQIKEVMNTTMQNLNGRTSSDAAMMMLDGSTRLRMAAEREPVRRTFRATAVSEPMAAIKVSVAKEAVGVSLLLALFTGAFWLLITFIRSH